MLLAHSALTCLNKKKLVSLSIFTYGKNKVIFRGIKEI